MENAAVESRNSMRAALISAALDADEYDPVGARQLLESKCSQCHSHTQVGQARPASRQDVVSLVQRMVGNGLAASDLELGTIIRYLTVTYVGAAAADAGPAALQNPGQQLYTQRLCLDCHGPAGRAPVAPDFPRLAGQNEAYLIRQFKDIQNGGRNNAITSTIRALVQNVSDREIVAIAAYLAAQQ